MEKQRHMTDQMFLVILFAVFAVCAFSLSMIGANVYSHTALIHTERINGKKYNIYLYQEKGALRELMVREGLDTTTMQGEKIVAAKDFSVIETKQLYHIKIQGNDGKIYQNCVYRHSRN